MHGLPAAVPNGAATTGRLKSLGCGEGLTDGVGLTLRDPGLLGATLKDPTPSCASRGLKSTTGEFVNATGCLCLGIAIWKPRPGHDELTVL